MVPLFDDDERNERMKHKFDEPTPVEDEREPVQIVEDEIKAAINNIKNRMFFSALTHLEEALEALKKI